MTRKHAIFAPSSAARWLQCPISAVMSAEVPERTSDEADEGTRVHALIEQALLFESGKPVTSPLDASEDDLWVLNLVVGFVRKLGPGQLFPERKVVINEHCWGTSDITHIGLSAKIATIADYKNGGFDVEAEENKQNLTYGVGVLREFPDIEWFRFVIIQPNSKTHGEVAPVKQWVAHASVVAEHSRKIEQAIARAHAGEKPIPGKHCRWCAAFGECSATRDTLPLIEQAIRMLPEQIPDAKIVRIAQVLRGFNDFHKLVDKEINRRMLLGKAPDGASLARARAFRQWRDPFMAKKQLFEQFGIDAFEPPTPAQAEKLGAPARAVVEALAFKPQGALKAEY